MTVVRRDPLTQLQRDVLREEIADGNASSNLLAPDSSPYEMLGCPAAGARGLIYFQDQINEGDGLEPDEARQFAKALLMLADHTEFGPGEWERGAWLRRGR